LYQLTKIYSTSASSIWPQRAALPSLSKQISFFVVLPSQYNHDASSRLGVLCSGG
jgi:hypothetical protein